MMDDFRVDENYLQMTDRSSAVEMQVMNNSRNSLLGPEKALMKALLDDAEAALSHKDSKVKAKHEAYVEAVEWFNSEDDEWVFSFVNICESLGLSVSATRRQYLSSEVKRKRYRNHDPYWQRCNEGEKT